MPADRRDSPFTKIALPLLIFCLGSAVTFALWQQDHKGQQQTLGEYFSFRSHDAVSRIETRLGQYEQALIDTRGLMEALGQADRRTFAAYVAHMDIGSRYPGIQGIGYSVLIPASQLAQHILAVRGEGFPTYAVRPQGVRDVYSSILYLEPFSARNQRAFGYDMYSEPVRRSAMDRAADTGTTALSGKVHLVQETNQDVQAGFLMYLPVHQRETRAVTGWVYAPFRAGDFMAGILGEGEIDLDLELYDSTTTDPDTKLYDTVPAEPTGTAVLWSETQNLTFGGRTWTIVVRALPSLLARHGSDSSGQVLWLGELISLLLALAVVLVRRQLTQARHLNAQLEETVRHRTQELLLREERLATILEGTHAGTWEWNVQTGETVFNERWAEIVGYTLQELAPVSIETWMKLAHPEDLVESDRLLNRVFSRQDHFYEMESRMLHKDGSWVWVHDRGAVAQWTGDGKPLMMRGTHTDITNRKRTEILNNELETRNHQLEKGASLARMASSIAHHFNNKLQAVTANLELAEAAPPGLPVAKYVHHALESAEKAAEVSRLLLVYLGQSTAVHVPTPLSRVVQDSVERLKKTWGAQVTVHTELEEPGPWSDANSEQFDQVVSALALNAAEALPGGNGTVKIRLSKVSHGQVTTVNRHPLDWQPSDQDYACLEVQDNGLGIDAENLERLFDPFFSTKFVGRGLGLSVVRGIVQSHHGAITVESLPGLGTLFRVYLPALAGGPAKPVAPSAAVRLPTGGKTILLVDDDEELLEPTQELLELLGYRVTVARDGREALSLFENQTQAIDCVITDLTMPNMDGWELLSALRAQNSPVPVVLASGYDKGEVLAGEHPNYPQGFLAKPFNLEELSRTLRELLG